MVIMKHLLLASVAGLMLLSSPAIAPASAQQGHDQDQHGQDQRSQNQRSQNQRGQDPRGHGDQDRMWNPSAHNGYTYKNKWHYGPPPTAYQSKPDFSPGYRQWTKGQRLPTYYRQHYGVVNYQAEHLRKPSRGYHWVRDERGDYLMVAITTGLIADLIIHASH
jgi:Ni/Co efflux regulator RcnB